MAFSLLLLSLAATMAGLWQQRRSSRELAAVQLGMRRIAAAFLEGSRAEAQLEDLRQLQKLAEQGIAFGTATVRSVHRGIASIPFGILEAIPVTRHPTRIVRSLHDQISDVVYDSIGGGNKLIGSALRLGLKKPTVRGAKQQSGLDRKCDKEQA